MKYKITTTLIYLVILSSCSFAPVAIAPDGTKVSLGGSLLENSQEEYADATMPNGTKLSYHKLAKNQSLGPSQLLLVNKMPSIIKSAFPSGVSTPATNTGTSTGGAVLGGAILGGALMNNNGQVQLTPQLQTHK